ncbi:MAG: serine/threonine-protein kinase [Pseudomonadota bacterium]
MKNSVEDTDAAPPNAFGDELPPGTVLCGGQYTIENYLNSGGFGITYLARDSLGRKVVIKECFPGAICCRHNESIRPRSKGGAAEFRKILKLFEKEALALSELQHPYIVGVHQFFKDNDTAYMALDFVPGRDLLQIINEDPHKLAPADIKQLLIQLLEAVSYLHDRGILHRDISPDNILIEETGAPVLIDFGAARESATRVSRVLSKVLTVKDGYSPHEFYLVGSEHQFSSDLYALAASFYHLVSGVAPPSSQVRLAAEARKTADPLMPLDGRFKEYETEFLDAINQCLSVFPGERIQTAREWRDLIDVERRKQILLQEAQQNLEIDARVSQLVRQSQDTAGVRTEQKSGVRTEQKSRKQKPAVAVPRTPPAEKAPLPADVAQSDTVMARPAYGRIAVSYVVAKAASALRRLQVNRHNN